MVSTVGVEIVDSECAPSAEIATRVWADGGTGASCGGGRAREPESELDAATDTVIEYVPPSGICAAPAPVTENWGDADMSESMSG